MKIITWNCNMAFRKKANNIISKNPDILIVPECENLEKLNLTEMIQIPSDVYWYESSDDLKDYDDVRQEKQIAMNHSKIFGLFLNSDFIFF